MNKYKVMLDGRQIATIIKRGDDWVLTIYSPYFRKIGEIEELQALVREKLGNNIQFVLTKTGGG